MRRVEHEVLYGEEAGGGEEMMRRGRALGVRARSDEDDDKVVVPGIPVSGANL